MLSFSLPNSWGNIKKHPLNKEKTTAYWKKERSTLPPRNFEINLKNVLDNLSYKSLQFAKKNLEMF